MADFMGRTDTRHPVAQRNQSAKRIERLHIMPVGRTTVDSRHNVPHHGIVVHVKIEIKEKAHQGERFSGKRQELFP